MQKAPTRKSVAKALGRWQGEEKKAIKAYVGKLVKERAPWLKHNARHGGGPKHRAKGDAPDAVKKVLNEIEKPEEKKDVASGN